MLEKRLEKKEDIEDIMPQSLRKAAESTEPLPAVHAELEPAAETAPVPTYAPRYGQETSEGFFSRLFK